MANVDLLPYQMDFLQSTEEECALIGGVGTGKTYSGAIFAITETALYPDVPGIIVANTYSQLMNATLVHLKNKCEELGIFYKYNRSTQTVTINGTEHFARSAELYDNSRGIEGGWLLMDEAAYTEEEATDVFIGRVRFRGGSLKKRYISTPNGFNWVYNRFSPEGEQYDAARKMIKAKTEDNYMLPASYAPHLRKTYCAAIAAQELDAEFISFAGSRVYSDFDQKRHVATVPKPTNMDQVYVIMDYNVSPFAAVCCYRKGNMLLAFDEIWLDNGDVRMMAKEIKKRQYHLPILIGDGTGNNRRNVASLKDTAYKIFAEEGMRTEPFANPNVSKRIANNNRLFFHNQAIIDPKCKMLIKDLNLVKYKTGSNDIDKTSNKLLSHISDAYSYAAWKHFPWQEPAKSRSYDL